MEGRQIQSPPTAAGLCHCTDQDLSSKDPGHLSSRGATFPHQQDKYLLPWALCGGNNIHQTLGAVSSVQQPPHRSHCLSFRRGLAIEPPRITERHPSGYRNSSHVEPDSQPARRPPHRDYNTGPHQLATDGRKRAMNVPLQMGTERKRTSGRGPPQTHPLSPQERPQTVGRDERRQSSGRSLPRRRSTTPSGLRDKTEFLKSSQQSADAGHMFYSGPWW